MSTSVNTNTRAYPAPYRPQVIIRGWEQEELYLTRINSRTAYFRGPHYVGEMAIDVQDVIEIIEP